MSSIENTVASRKDNNDKNKQTIYCTFCPSKILNHGAATYVNMQFALPNMLRKGEGEADEREAISDCWMVEDVFTFENIGYSNTVGNVKYLVCADCELGPVGWHDISTNKSYVALSRVKHE